MGFADAFTKTTTAGALEYDDAAFAYFGFTFLLLLTFVYIVYYIRRYHRKKINTKLQCPCKFCKRYITHTTKTTTEDQFKYYHLSLIILLAICTYILQKKLSILLVSKTFDPYTILDVTPDISKKELKKRFRTLSLKYHPDKNPNDATASAKFILISKAFRTLNDPVAFENFVKFGNPDGKASLMKLSIGLPSILLSENLQVGILWLFMLLVIFVLPTCIYLIYKKVTTYNINGLHKSTIYYIADKLNQNNNTIDLLDYICSSYEVRSLNLTATEDELTKLKAYANITYDELAAKDLNKKIAIYLIGCHLNRKSNEIPNKFRKSLITIVDISEKVTTALLHIAFINNWIPVIQSVIYLRKSLYQCVPLESHLLCQIAFMTTERAEFANKAIKAIIEKNNTEAPKYYLNLIKLVLKYSDQTIPWATEQEKEIIKDLLNVIPNINLTADIYTEDESQIVEGDLVTVSVQIEITNFIKDMNMHYIHAPYYPKPAECKFFVVITDAKTNNICASDFVKCNGKHTTIEIKFPIYSSGLHKYSIACLADSFFGIDQIIHKEVNVSMKTEGKRNAYIHPEDVALDK